MYDARYKYRDSHDLRHGAPDTHAISALEDRRDVRITGGRPERHSAAVQNSRRYAVQDEELMRRRFERHAQVCILSLDF